MLMIPCPSSLPVTVPPCYARPRPRTRLLQVGLIYATVFQLGLYTYKASPFPAASVSVGFAGFACSSALKVRLCLCLLSAALCSPQCTLRACSPLAGLPVPASHETRGPQSQLRHGFVLRAAGSCTSCDPPGCRRRGLDLGFQPPVASFLGRAWAYAWACLTRLTTGLHTS